MIGTERLAQEVFESWRDGMLRQGREVAPQRMNWHTLAEQDRELDRYIGERLAKLLAEAMGGRNGAWESG